MITFNCVLQHERIDPRSVVLLRHQITGSRTLLKPYDLWRAANGSFEAYQSIQSKARFRKDDLLASFVVTPADETLFVGLYLVQSVGGVPPDQKDPVAPDHDLTGCFWHVTMPDTRLDEYSGRLLIDWGKGFRTWVQSAGRQDKRVIEIRRSFQEPEFPGFLLFSRPLSQIDALPKGWADALQACRGVYLLTCPRTKEQYVGSAAGANGFLGRWQEYAITGHGGNIALKSRDPSDYQVSILEVAGSAATVDEIIRMEQRWKAKLQSTEMGLNRN